MAQGLKVHRILHQISITFLRSYYEFMLLAYYAYISNYYVVTTALDILSDSKSI